MPRTKKTAEPAVEEPVAVEMAGEETFEEEVEEQRPARRRKAGEKPPDGYRVPDYSKLVGLKISETVDANYIAYARGVLTDRAFPHIGDGQKPVQRRILYTLWEENITTHTKKSARIVGACMGKYHPHGDSSIYEAQVNMVALFKNNLPLIDGQGNFGSLDGSSAAAMRYTEAKLSLVAKNLITDELRFRGKAKDDTIVPMQPNYDDTLQEPLYLPAKINFLLINGSSGIGVVVRCNIPPYSPREVIEATKYITQTKKYSRDKLLDEIITAPSFPIPTVIIEEDLPKIRQMHEKGTGSFRVFAPVTIHEKNRRKFLISGLTPQTDTEKLIGELAQHDAVSNVQDESTSEIRIIVTCTKPAEEVIDDLYRKTSLCKTFSVAANIISETNEFVSSNLVDMLERFIRLRMVTIEKRINLQLQQLEREISENSALVAVLGNIDKFLDIVKNSTNPQTASEAVAKFFKIEPWQADYVLGLSIKTITKAERKKIEELLAQLEATRKKLQKDLQNVPSILVKEQEEVAQSIQQKSPELMERKTKIQKKPYIYGTF